MPLYEYICEQTGEVIELLRPMSRADDPVDNPERKGRVFTRKLSTFMAKNAPSAGSASLPQACCPCGKNAGACGRN
jgi:putative FmdB family regulatory protein